jgi:outer membrane protein assembly factor BamE
MKPVLRLLVVVPVLFFAACSTVSEKLSPYKIDIPQGNVVTQEMVAKLKPGMTKSQVRFIMGTPLIADVFHASRWDYVYRYLKAGKLTEERKLALFFEKDLLQRVEGDVIAVSPASADKQQSAAPAPGGEASQGAAAGAKEEKGFFGRAMEKIGF